MSAPLRILALCGALVLLSSAGAQAVGLSGALTPLGGATGCLRDRARPAAEAGACPQAIPGLAGAGGMALSPDGRDLYVAASEPGSVVALVRRRTGGLAPLVKPAKRSCVQTLHGADCELRVPGLAGASAVAVSPDGRNVYVGAADAGAVVALRRSTHGALSALPRPAHGKRKGHVCLHGTEAAPGAAAGCPARMGALGRVSALALSPDGHFLYVLSSGNVAGEDTLVALARQRDGSLSPVRGCAASQGGGRPRCSRRAAGLRGAAALAISADGRYAYVAAPVSSAVSAFALNRTSGDIAPLAGGGACLADPGGDAGCPAHAAGLRSADGLLLSSDGGRVYVAGFDPGSITVLARDPAHGGLAAIGGAAACLQAGPRSPPCTAGQDVLRGAGALALAGRGSRLIVGAIGADTVIDVGLTGGVPALPLAPFAHAAPIGGPGAILLSRDGRMLYVTSALDDELVVLNT